jgi:pentafunctional AROM polypeptide
MAVVLSDAVTIDPQPPVRGTVRVPGSKSISNRVLVMAALGRGTCRIRGLLHSDDTQVMLDAIRTLAGPDAYSWEEGGEVLVVNGTDGKLTAPPTDGKRVFLGNAGTASRFLTTVATLCTGGGGSTVLDGVARMRERPIGPLVDALRSIGCEIDYLGTQGCLPLRVGATTGLPGGTVALDGSVSSQYVSSILLSAPYNRGSGGGAGGTALTLALASKPISQPYIDLTIGLMAIFGVDVIADRETHKYTIPSGGYVNPPEVTVEADASSATYPMLIAAATGGTVTVLGVGSKSLQGDARFHEVLTAMGCTVAVDEYATTVTGPSYEPLAGDGDGDRDPLSAEALAASDAGFLRPITMDLEHVTDTFLGAAAVLALARGKSTLTGIANQRVKECNRLAAMCTELGKLGIAAEEVEDGMVIHGIGYRILGENAARLAAERNIDVNRDALRSIVRGAPIWCYGDHRIAMAFAALGTALSGVVVQQKDCVDKTYPEFWEHAQVHLGIKVRAVVEGESEGKGEGEGEGKGKGCAGGDSSSSSSCSLPATLVIIGMRASGKTSLGRGAAAALERGHVDLDDIFEERHGPIKDFIASHDWPAFRAAESEVLRDTLAAIRDRTGKFAAAGNQPAGWIVSTGGGVVEGAANRALLTGDRSLAPVVLYLRRDAADIEATLTADATRPPLPEPVAATLARRGPHFASCSTHEFSLLPGDTDWAAATREFTRVVAHLTARGGCPAPMPGHGSTFVSLTFPDYRDTDARARIADIAADTDALELRADLLADKTADAVREQIAALRRASTLPIVFTVRTEPEGGKFTAADGGDRAAAALLEIGIRTGCEYVDVEESLPRHLVTGLCRLKGNTRIIGSCHVTSAAGATAAPQGAAASDRRKAPPARITAEWIEDLAEACTLRGRADIAKVVFTATPAPGLLYVATASFLFYFF